MGSSWRGAGPLAALAACALVSCGDPELESELNPEGPPEVLEVNVRTESGVLDGINVGEAATFCIQGEEYKVSEIYCPLARDEETDAPIPGVRPYGTVEDADPDSWYVRVIFDELLEPSLEKFRTDGRGQRVGTIRESEVFVLTCDGEEIVSDGWLDPGGNALGQPPGPAMVLSIRFDEGEFVATNSSCEVVVTDNMVDKDGEQAPLDQRGPYTFDIAQLAFYSMSPADGTQGVRPDTTIQAEFNAPIDLDSVEGQFVVSRVEGEEQVPVAGTFDYLRATDGTVADRSSVVFTPAAELAPATTYTVTIDPGVADIAGGTPLLVDDPDTSEVVETRIVATFTTRT